MIETMCIDASFTTFDSQTQDCQVALLPDRILRLNVNV